MRIATFNIEHGTGADGGVASVAELVDAVASLDADIIGLQEVDRGVGRSGRVDQAAEVAEALGATYTFASARKLDGGDYGNALLVRGGLSDVTVVPLERRFRTEPRCAIVANVEVGDVVAGVGVTHLEVDNALAVEQLIQFVDAMVGRPTRRILLGDLNLGPDDVLPTTTAEGYRLVRAAPTFPSASPRAQIDHVALRGFEVHDVDVVATPISDHRALVVDVA